ncbi:hypothetical protein ACFYO9_26855 [Streptomyces sp. NPDC005863]|uniref:hypothetical protein n=1 Tax=unclassified Streptomyces TaxID=2593676 RepID=UPI0033D49154
MNNSTRMLASLSFVAAAAAAVATAAPAQAAVADEGNRHMGRVVGEALSDPTGTGKEVLDAGKTGLTVAEMGLKSVKTSSQSFQSR